MTLPEARHLRYLNPLSLPLGAADDAEVRARALANSFTALPGEVQSRLTSYVTSSAPTAKRAQVSEFVRVAAAAVAPANTHTLEQTTAPAAKLAIWAHVRGGLPLRFAVVFAPATVALFLKAEDAEGRGGTARNYRKHLERIADALGVAVTSSPAPIVRTSRALPYTQSELTQIALWARTRTGLSRRRAEALLALSAGAGLRSQEVLAMRAREVILDDPDGWVRVTGGADRLSPVLAQWKPLLRRHVEALGPDDFLFPRTQNFKGVISDWVKAQKAAPEPQRLRATFVLEHLKAGTDPESLLRWTGIERGETLANYLPLLDGPVDENRRRTLAHLNLQLPTAPTNDSLPRTEAVEGTVVSGKELGKQAEQ